MPKLDPFSAQIVNLVRNMSDDAILELVRNRLGLAAPASVVAAPVVATSSRTTRRAPAKRKAKAARKVVAKRTPKARRKTRRKARPSAERAKTLDLVERIIKTGKGLSASEIVKRTKLPQSRVSSAVRELKEGKRIFQGGDRRFARYAGDARTALQASEKSRKTAPGPIRKGGKARRKAKRR